MKPIIVIPSYWRKGPIIENDFPYDHPTNLLDPEETISKTLDSLTKINGDFDVLVIGIPTRFDIGYEVDQALTTLIASIKLPFKTYYFGYKEFKRLEEFLDRKVSQNAKEILSLSGYGNIRNLSLIVPHILDYKNVIFIDDDELIIDKDFIKKATQYIGTEIDGKNLGLVLGYYINENDTIYLNESNLSWWEFFWDKPKIMNQAFTIINGNNGNKKARLIETPFAFGGNMIIHKECWMKVPFDPFIKRGEDMDYLRNVKFFGFAAKLDRTLSIKHEPPQSQIPYKIKLQQDIFRFLYAKAKSAALNIDTSDYNPYPGFFLEQTEGKTILTEFLLQIFQNQVELLESQTIEEFYDKLLSFSFIFKEAKSYSNRHSSGYMKFQQHWEEFLTKFPLNFPFEIVSSIENLD